MDTPYVFTPSPRAVQTMQARREALEARKAMAIALQIEQAARVKRVIDMGQQRLQVQWEQSQVVASQKVMEQAENQALLLWQAKSNARLSLPPPDPDLMAANVAFGPPSEVAVLKQRVADVTRYTELAAAWEHDEKIWFKWANERGYIDNPPADVPVCLARVIAP